MNLTRGVPEKSRKEFYNMRSSLTHGRGLLRWDRHGHSFSPASLNEQQKLRWLFLIVRIALFNWLSQQANS